MHECIQHQIGERLLLLFHLLLVTRLLYLRCVAFVGRSVVYACCWRNDCPPCTDLSPQCSVLCVGGVVVVVVVGVGVVADFGVTMTVHY